MGNLFSGKSRREKIEIFSGGNVRILGRFGCCGELFKLSRNASLGFQEAVWETRSLILKIYYSTSN